MLGVVASVGAAPSDGTDGTRVDGTAVDGTAGMAFMADFMVDTVSTAGTVSTVASIAAACMAERSGVACTAAVMTIIEPA
jgi:hypothetical protein